MSMCFAQSGFRHFARAWNTVLAVHTCMQITEHVIHSGSYLRQEVSVHGRGAHAVPVSAQLRKPAQAAPLKHLRSHRWHHVGPSRAAALNQAHSPKNTRT